MYRLIRINVVEFKKISNEIYTFVMGDKLGQKISNTLIWWYLELPKTP